MPAEPTGYTYGSRAAEVPEEQTEDILDAWYGFRVSQPHLVAYVADLGGQPIERYLVRGPFGQWILDTCARPHDDQWLAHIRPFLATKGGSVDVVERMYQAWGKAVILQITLWALAYGKGEW